VDSYGLREVVGSRLPRVVGDELEYEGGKSERSRSSSCSSSWRAQRAASALVLQTVGEMLSM